MPRTARSIRPGGYYHVLNRGNNRAAVFHEPDDFDVFVRLMTKAQDRRHLKIAAACLMPNHFHLVVRPDNADDLSIWLHWLLTVHASRFHREKCSSGRIWTGRFKAFPIQDDRHLLTVVRYVERNPLRAGLVGAAEDWRWGSLYWRMVRSSQPSLAELPFPLPGNWCEFVNAPQTPQEIAAIRQSVNRGRPFGDSAWVARTAAELGLTHTLSGRGRRPGSARQGDSAPVANALPN